MDKSNWDLVSSTGFQPQPLAISRKITIDKKTHETHLLNIIKNKLRTLYMHRLMYKIQA